LAAFFPEIRKTAGKPAVSRTRHWPDHISTVRLYPSTGSSWNSLLVSPFPNCARNDLTCRFVVADRKSECLATFPSSSADAMTVSYDLRYLRPSAARITQALRLNDLRLSDGTSSVICVFLFMARL